VFIQGPNGPQHDRPAACVIAQQYSSITFFSLCKKKFDALFKKFTTSIFNFLKIALSLKFRNFKSGSVSKFFLQWLDSPLGA
jgi:uncharacterized membrane protein YwzB